MRILLVEDDREQLAFLAAVLETQNYVVDVATDGLTGWQMVETFAYDLVVLDVNLPRLDGLTFCRRLRQNNSPVLVMLLTARDTATDKMMGLDSGADDYVSKPYDLQELIARIRALLRRGTIVISPTLCCAQLTLDLNNKEISYQGKCFQFSRKEYLLLELFMRNPQRVFSRSEIVDRIWSIEEEPPNEDTIKSHIKSIRRKLGKANLSDWIETIYGQGYRINPIYQTVDKAQMTHTVLPTLPVIDSANPPPASAAITQQQHLDQAATTIWLRHRATYFNRLANLEQAIATLQSGNGALDMQESALQTAHQLAGSLGTFGCQSGSQIAQHIERLLSAQPLNSRYIHQAASLVLELRHLLNSYLKDTPSQPDAPLLPQLIQAQEAIAATVLIIDDDPTIAQLIESILSPRGIKVVSQTSPEGVWESLTATHPALLILDMNMPTLSGLELCQAIRTSAEWAWLPILFLTVRAEQHLIQQAYAIGADDYITKPIAPNELMIRVVNRLKRSQLLISHR